MSFTLAAHQPHYVRTPRRTGNGSRDYTVQGRTESPRRATHPSDVAQQQQLIRSAAAALDKSVTDSVLESANSHAERVLPDRRWFVLSDQEWEDFQGLLDAPVSRTPKLAKLLNEPTVFDSTE